MRFTALAATALVLGLATGCSGHGESPSAALGAVRSPQGESTDHTNLPASVDWHRGAPPGAVPTREDGTTKPLAASWVVDGSRIQITVWGSGSCPAAGSSASVAGNGTSVTLVLRSYPTSRPCTADVQPTTSIVTLPDGAHVAKRVRVIVTGPAGSEWSIPLDR